MRSRYQWQSGQRRAFGYGFGADAAVVEAQKAVNRLATLLGVLYREREILEGLGERAPKCAVDGLNLAMSDALKAMDDYAELVLPAVPVENKVLWTQAINEARDNAHTLLKPLTKMWADGPEQWKYPPSIVVPGRSLGGFRGAFGVDPVIGQAAWWSAHPPIGTALPPPPHVGIGPTFLLWWFIGDSVAPLLEGDPSSPIGRAIRGGINYNSPLGSMIRSAFLTEQIPVATAKAVAHVKDVYKQLYALHKVQKAVLASAKTLEQANTMYGDLMAVTDPAMAPPMPDDWMDKGGTWPSEVSTGVETSKWTMPVMILLGLVAVGILMSSED